MALAPCTTCGRHVRVGASDCPFCDASLRSTRAPLPALFGLVLGLSVTGCGTDEGGPSTTMDNMSSDAGGETYGGADWDDDGVWAESSGGANGTTTLDGDSSSDGRPMTTAMPDDAGGETYGGPEWDTGTASDTASDSTGTTGSETAGSETAGSETAGSETAGSETAGSTSG